MAYMATTVPSTIDMVQNPNACGTKGVHTMHRYSRPTYNYQILYKTRSCALCMLWPHEQV